MGCHREKVKMEGMYGLGMLTSCKVLPWFTSVNVWETRWKNTRGSSLLGSRQYEEGNIYGRRRVKDGRKDFNMGRSFFLP